MYVTHTHIARFGPRERAGPSSIALLLPYGGGPTWHPPSLHAFTVWVLVCVFTMQIMYKEGERLENCAHTGLCVD